MGVEATEPSERELDDLAGSLAPFNPRIILTGAGFTKPWGGYLASELWSVIVSHPALRAAPETDMVLHDQLNFEETLARVQAEPETFRKENGEAILWRAVLEAFAVMDSRIARWSIEDQHTVLGDLIRDLAATAGSSTTFFFTLNQDLFVERTIPGCDGTLPPLVVPQGGGALTPGDPFGGPTKVVVLHHRRRVGRTTSPPDTGGAGTGGAGAGRSAVTVMAGLLSTSPGPGRIRTRTVCPAANRQ
jgi:hypothetical protein